MFIFTKNLYLCTSTFATFSFCTKLSLKFCGDISQIFSKPMLKQLPSRERLLAVKKLSSEIFGETFNPQNIRNGLKVLRKPLVGPEVASYYGKNDSMPTFKDFKAWFPELKLVDPREETRLKMVADRKKRNKGAPKKKSS